MFIIIILKIYEKCKSFLKSHKEIICIKADKGNKTITVKKRLKNNYYFTRRFQYIFNIATL